MNAVDFYFVDEGGKRLSPDKDEAGVQHVRQYASRWRIYVDGEWTGRVAIEHDPLLYLVPVSINEWELPDSIGSDVLKGAVGSLSAMLLDNSDRVIGSKRVLRIQPANVTWDELEQMLEDVGLLALLSSSCTQADVWMPVQEDIGIAGVGLPHGIGHGPLQTASGLTALYKALRQSWPVIQQRPLKSIISKPGVVRLDRAKSSPMLMIKRKIEPNRLTAAGLVITEDTDCPENRFLVFLLDHYLINLAKGVTALLETAAAQLAQDSSGTSLPPAGKNRTKLRAFTDRKRHHAVELNSQHEATRQSIILKISELKDVVTWASAARSSSFLKPISTPTQLPVGSLRLTHSSHYGPVYAKFVECQTTATGGLERVLYLLECIQKQRIRPAWNIYELWCIAKLYTTFITDLHLKPPKGEQSLFERIEFADGELCLPTNTPFRLIGRFGDRNIEIEIWYEKEYPGQRAGSLIANPDIVVAIKVDGVSSEFCFDAKYRDYSSQGVKTFLDDVYTRAYLKYQKQFCFQAGFILHTDRKVDYWGEVKIGEFLSEQFHSNASPTPEYAKHRYGAVSLRPNVSVDYQFRKLMLLVFQYHGSFQDTCLNCGYRLKPIDDMQHDWGNDPKKYNLSDEDVVLDVINNRRDRKGTGVYCACPKCGNFWVIQRCKGANHPLVKTSPELCIHRPSALPEHKGKWMYVCPTCGSDPSFSDYASTTDSGKADEWCPEDKDAPQSNSSGWHE